MNSDISRGPEAGYRDIAAWLKAEARKGADALHARATAADAKAKPRTDAESAAIARARIDGGKS